MKTRRFSDIAFSAIPRQFDMHSHKEKMRMESQAKEGQATLWQQTVSSFARSIRPLFSMTNPIVQPVLDRSHMRNVKNAVNIDDLREIAQRRAHAMVFAYLDGGADGEVALRRSVDAYHNTELRHAVLHNVGNNSVNLSTKVLDVEAELPFFLTSCAGQRMFHADGEVATARAAKRHGTAMALSQLTTTSFSDVTEVAPDQCKILQLYVWRDRDILCEVLKQARNAGFESLALTADFSWVGNRERETRTGFTVPPSYNIRQCIDAIRAPAWTFDYLSREPYGYKAVPEANFPAETLVDFIANQMKPDFNWEDAQWLIQEWKRLGGKKCALKGVASAEDASRAIDIGFDSIWVSNHGGRQLESSVPTIDILPEVRQAVGEDVEVILDGGIRRGIDIVKALALGADSVAIGRAYLYGLTAGGEAGVDKAISLLKRDVKLAFGLLGCTSVAEIRKKGPKLVKKLT